MSDRLTAQERALLAEAARRSAAGEVQVCPPRRHTPEEEIAYLRGPRASRKGRRRAAAERRQRFLELADGTRSGARIGAVMGMATERVFSYASELRAKGYDPRFANVSRWHK